MHVRLLKSIHLFNSCHDILTPSCFSTTGDIILKILPLFEFYYVSPTFYSSFTWTPTLLSPFVAKKILQWLHNVPKTTWLESNRHKLGTQECLISNHKFGPFLYITLPLLGKHIPLMSWDLWATLAGTLALFVSGSIVQAPFISKMRD